MRDRKGAVVKEPGGLEHTCINMYKHMCDVGEKKQIKSDSAWNMEQTLFNRKPMSL